MKVPTLASGPHTHSLFNVPRTMIAVMVCLSPATAYGMWQFGWPAVYLFGVTLISAYLFEIACLMLAGKPVALFARDGSAFLTGWLVAMSLPPWAPWWIGMLGAGIAIVIGKHLFGGLGQNLFNPAMVARAMLLIALPVHMTTWVPPQHGRGPDPQAALHITFGGGAVSDATSSASVLGQIDSLLDTQTPMSEILGQIGTLEDLALGATAGSLGETSAVLLLAGGLALILMRIVTVTVPLAVLGSLFACAGAGWVLAPDRFPPPQYHLASGAVMMCAFFIATDYVTAPVTAMGKAIYGTGIGVLTFVIRSFGAFPEGVAFAVLLMNACTPLIDTYVRPRIFGRTRSGKPLPIGDRT